MFWNNKGFVLLDALMAVLLLSCGVALLLQYQWHRTMVGMVLIRQAEVMSMLNNYHEKCIVAKQVLPHPDNWNVREAQVKFSVKRCSFAVKELHSFCWQQIHFPWPEVHGVHERYVVSGYACK